MNIDSETKLLHYLTTSCDDGWLYIVIADIVSCLMPLLMYKRVSHSSRSTFRMNFLMKSMLLLQTLLLSFHLLFLVRLKAVFLLVKLQQVFALWNMNKGISITAIRINVC